MIIYEVYYGDGKIETFDDIEKAEEFYDKVDIKYDVMLVCKNKDGRVRILEMRKGVK